jgi:CheY-like chemotaxis protein
MPRRVLVVDDELAGLRKAHVIGSKGDFYEILSDVTDPRFENLREVALTVPAAAPFVTDEKAAAAYFDTDEAVRDLFLSPQIQAHANQQVLDLLAAFLGRHERVERLRNDFQTAFPDPEFAIDFVGARPALQRLTQFEAVFLDLFLEDGSPGPVPEVKEYLKGISDEAAEIVLPPIILMSSHTELQEHRRNFSEGAHISAAGLMILPKEKIADPQFGADGLRLSLDLLARQSSVAHGMRLFMASWMGALEKATEDTSKILWNLDASAMQQFHLASVRDDDPYDEHLGELLSRDHLHRVESDANVKTRIAGLDQTFRMHLSPDPREIGNRMMAPLVDVASSRELMSHFTWLGALPTQPLLSYLEIECADRISRSLPFGSVLCGPTISKGERFLVHITQQCDLNGISREKNLDGTLIFAMADARELLPSDHVPGSSELVLKNLQIQDGATLREFDLKVVGGAMLAMPLSDFLARARRQRLRVVGRLRSDVANQIVAATSNHMARPAAQLMLRSGMLRCKVFLRWTAPPPGGTSALKEASGKGCVFSLTKENKDTFSFQDDACVDIALWLKGQLPALNVQLDTDALCTALRKVWRSDTHLLGALRVKVRECDDLDKAFKALKGDIAANEVQLTVVFET